LANAGWWGYTYIPLLSNYGEITPAFTSMITLLYV
jgi:hypothetical protein